MTQEEKWFTKYNEVKNETIGETGYYSRYQAPE